jgi:hypothetical protein
MDLHTLVLKTREECDKAKGHLIGLRRGTPVYVDTKDRLQRLVNITDTLLKKLGDKDPTEDEQ